MFKVWLLVQRYKNEKAVPVAITPEVMRLLWDILEMFPPYSIGHMNPGGMPVYSMFPYMAMPTFPSQVPLSNPSSPSDVDITSSRECSTPDEGNISASSSIDCSSGYSSSDSTLNSPAFSPQCFRPGPFSCCPPPFPFWAQPSAMVPSTGFPPRPPTTPEGPHSQSCNQLIPPGYPPSPINQRYSCIPGWIIPYGFPPHCMVPPRMSTPESASFDRSFISPVPSDSKSSPEKNTPVKRSVRAQKRQSAEAMKSQRAITTLELIVDLLMNDTQGEIIEWTSTKSLEFMVRDRKKFIAHWNRLLGKRDSFMAVSCILRSIGNEKVVTIYGEKVTFITRTSPYTYRFFPDHDLPRIPILRDENLQRLLTKILLSFHLHLRKYKKVAEPAMFQPSTGFSLLSSLPSPIQPRTGSSPEKINLEIV
ncbi:hypothetical protein RB195_005161 [Necator americanus]|uniref:ETS domain-containing protein n=2 Tax=Necator americanus TaxID=51031 RepID=A0ABR1BPX8_NECAM